MSETDRVDETAVRELFARVKVDERAGFRDELRSRLLAQVRPAATVRGARPWWVLPVPRAAVAAFAIAAMLFGGGGLAAAGSLPGEPLFELKRAAEEVGLLLAFDDETKVERLAAQAQARLTELMRASDGPGKSVAARESARALERLAEVQRGGSAEEPGSRASDTAESARDHAESVLRDLETKLPAEAADGIRRAIDAGRPEQPGKPGTDDSRGTRQSPRGSDAPGRPDRSPGPPSGRDR